MLSKSYYILFFFLMLVYSVFGNASFNLSAYKPVFRGFGDSTPFLEGGLALDNIVMIFLLMVLAVTCMVVLYGEMYMDHYNNKKFFFLTMFFFFSMLTLCLSGSIFILMTGWDFLGISSLCLIMFYPGKIPLFNSYMTFFYNRLGDCFLLLILAFFFLDSFFFYFLFLDGGSSFLFCLIVLCAFTKSAQFPFSSWLPAAMSAPTPISAMVHSSTLVTAGVFLMVKFFFALEQSPLFLLVFLVCALTFLGGGLLGFLESDLKKMVAFSTMSQISMILFFVSTGSGGVGLCHMFFHAFFKTLLFCCCGVSFMWVLSDQSSKSLNWVKETKILLPLSVVSIFSMSGLIFSSSFFSKDFMIEELWSNNELLFLLVLLFGSFFTLLYSCKIFISFIVGGTSFLKVGVSKFSSFKFFWVFVFLTLSSPYLIQNLLFVTYSALVGWSDMLATFLVFLVSLSVLIFFSKTMSFLSSEILFSKPVMFSLNGKIMGLDEHSHLFSDQMAFKPFLSPLLLVSSPMKFNLTFFLVFFILVFMLMVV